MHIRIMLKQIKILLLQSLQLIALFFGIAAVVGAVTLLAVTLL